MNETTQNSAASEKDGSFFETSGIQKTLAKIQDAQESGVDWEEEAGQAVSDATCRRAIDIVKATVVEADAHRLEWCAPSVSPTLDGGVHLSWYVNDERAAMTLFALPVKVQFFGKSNGQTSTHLCVEDEEAVKRVLDIFLFQKAPQAKVG